MIKIMYELQNKKENLKRIKMACQRHEFPFRDEIRKEIKSFHKQT